MRKNKSLVMALSIVLALTTVICGTTFAWFTSSDYLINHLETAKFAEGDVTIIETFDPPENWQPGQEINKDVGAINTGSADALVRISFAEILNKLMSSTPVSEGSGYSIVRPAPQSVASIDYPYTVPQLVDKNSYMGWTVLTPDAFNAGGEFAGSTPVDIPANVTVVYKKTTVVAGGTQYKYTFAAYYTIQADAYVTNPNYTRYVGEWQKVNAVYAVEGGKLTISDWSYQAFDRATYEIDWRDQPASSNEFFTGSPTWIFSQTDNDDQIQLIFTSAVKTNLDLCNAGDWWYNQDDGYFYYIGTLESGTATANNLLDSIKLLGSADSTYSNMDYDLTVILEAIQNVSAAIRATDGGGWSLTNAALLAKLDLYCNNDYTA